MGCLLIVAGFLMLGIPNMGVIGVVLIIAGMLD